MSKATVEPAVPIRPQEILEQWGGRRLGKKVHYFAELDSTNAYACRLAREKASEGEVVIAESQTLGRGRLGRSWVSPPYRNLYLSLILRPTLAPADAPQITLMAAVTLAETVQAFATVRPEIKWPNDILIDGRKLAGILTESSCESGRIDFVVLGMGVNLNFPREEMPRAIRESATSLLIVTGKPVDRTEFTGRLIQGLNRCYGELEDRGFAPLAERWESFSRLNGKRVKVRMADESILGKAVGIDRQGALLLEEEGGGIRKIVAGDVIPIEP